MDPKTRIRRIVLQAGEQKGNLEMQCRPRGTRHGTWTEWRRDSRGARYRFKETKPVVCNCFKPRKSYIIQGKTGQDRVENIVEGDTLAKD